MADNLNITEGSGKVVATDEVSNVHYQQVKLVDGTNGNTGAIPGDATNGLDVDVTRLPALVTGNASIGSVGIVAPLPSLPTGTNSIGSVGIIAPLPSLPTGTNSIGSVGIIAPLPSLPTGTNSIGTVGIVGPLPGIAGNLDHEEIDSGNPVKIGAKAESSLKGVTLVSDGDRTNLFADTDGVLIIKPFTSYGDLISQRVVDASGSLTAFSVFSAVASTRNYITDAIVFNESVGSGYLNIQESAGASGTVLLTIPLPLSGGAIINLSAPMKASYNTPLAYKVSSALSTVYLTLNGFQSKV